MILFLIGQIGTGKTTIGQRLAVALHARFLSVDGLRQQGAAVNAEHLARMLVEQASFQQLIVECSGAADDFEDLLSRLATAGKRAFVVLLDCPIETAKRRVDIRADWAPPRGGGSWASHLRWTAMRLRQVPADFVVDTNSCSPDQAGTDIAAAFDRAARQEPPTAHGAQRGRFSFSQLATHEVCPRAYRFKYVERRPELIQTTAMVIGTLLHESLRFLYGARSEGKVAETEVQAFLSDRITATLGSGVSEESKLRITNQATALLHFHYATVYRHETAVTQDLEKAFTLQLAPDLTFTGIIDRIALAPSGTVEVIDYKSSARKRTSRPRVPDMLQLAAYGVATLLDYQLPTVRAHRHLIPTAEQESIVLGAEDTQRISMALIRWIGQCTSDQQHHARPGRHCASCQFNPMCDRAAFPADAEALPGAAYG
ncbi:MAG: hypothetical protein F8N15_00915 [Methanobacterium sp.]|nr:hypothetical protein [Methanobacterium sp.]